MSMSLASFVTNAGIIASSLFVLGSTSAEAQVRIAFGQPTAKGDSSITIQAEIPGVVPQAQGNPPAVSINLGAPVFQGGKIVSQPADITISIPAGSTALDKANDVAAGLKLAFGSTSGLGRDPNDPNKPTVLLPKGSTFTVTKDTTGEPIIAVRVLANTPAKSNIFQIGWANAVTGLAESGNLSAFDVQFGYDGLTDNATFFADQLPSLTLAGLEQEMFAQLEANLPASLKANLSIDAQDYGLTFVIPDGSVDPFMHNETTDIGTQILGGMSDVETTPEPTSVVLLASGLLPLAAVMRKRIANRFRHATRT